MGVLASVPTFNQKHRRMIFFSHSTTGFLTKCYRNICCSDNRDVKANNVSTVQAFSWVCRVLPLLLNLFIFSAQEISEKGEEAEEVRRCSIRGHRGEVKIKERFGSFFSGSNSSYCMMLPLSYHACHLLFTQFVSHPQWQIILHMRKLFKNWIHQNMFGLLIPQMLCNCPSTCDFLFAFWFWPASMQRKCKKF